MSKWDGVGLIPHWMPIESAPLNIYVLLYRPTAPTWMQVTEGKWEGQIYNKKPRPFWYCPWGIAYNDDCRNHSPTHWMPLPSPPSKAKGE